MKTAIVSAFPACGKSYFHNSNLKDDFTTLDSDSSLFSWILDDQGNSTEVRNPEFPANYIQHIRDHLGKVDFIFVSSHDEVKQALEDAMLPYVLVMPSPKLKAEWIGRCWLRGSPEGFLKLIDTQWDTWTNIDNLRMNWNPVAGVTLTSGEYLSDKIWFLETCKYSY